MKSLYLILIHCMCHKILIYKKIQAQSVILLIMYFVFIIFIQKKSKQIYNTHEHWHTQFTIVSE